MAIKQSIGFVASSHNMYDGTFKLGGTDEISTGTFVELDDAKGTATLCKATPDSNVYFVAQENDQAPERVPSDLILEIKPGTFLKLFALVEGAHIVTNQAAEELTVGTKVYPVSGKLTSTAPDTVIRELIVREIIMYGTVKAYRCEVLK